jgi:phage/conjugal plasmid C-4 type zinc finger TraR family protein
LNWLAGNLAFDRAGEVSARERDAAIARAAASVKSEGSERCIDCGAAISRERKRAAPFARRCFDCQEAMERGA